MAQQLQQFIGGQVGDDELEIWLGFGSVDLLHGAAESKNAAADRGEAVDGVEGSQGMAIRRSAGDVKVEGVRGLKGFAVKVAGRGGELKAERVGHSGDVCCDAGIAAPAQVASDKHARHLTQRSAAPLRLQVERQLVCGGCALHAAAYLHLAGIGKREIDVRAHGLGGEAELPFVGIFQPYRDVGIEEGEGQLLIAVLEVDARVGGFDIGEAAQAADDGAAGRRLLCTRSLQQHGGEVPLSARSPLEIETGLIERNAGDFQPAAPERHDAKGRGDARALQDGFVAIAGSGVDDEVGDLHAGARQQFERDAGDFHGTPERGGE